MCLPVQHQLPVTINVCAQQAHADHHRHTKPRLRSTQPYLPAQSTALSSCFPQVLVNIASLWNDFSLWMTNWHTKRDGIFRRQHFSHLKKSLIRCPTSLATAGIRTKTDLALDDMSVLTLQATLRSMTWRCFCVGFLEWILWFSSLLHKELWHNCTNCTGCISHRDHPWDFHPHPPTSLLCHRSSETLHMPLCLWATPTHSLLASVEKQEPKHFIRSRSDSLVPLFPTFTVVKVVTSFLCVCFDNEYLDVSKFTETTRIATELSAANEYSRMEDISVLVGVERADLTWVQVTATASPSRMRQKAEQGFKLISSSSSISSYTDCHMGGHTTNQHSNVLPA